MHARKTYRTQGMTLIEVAISLAILSMITLVLLGATIPLSDAGAGQGAALDMDRQANKFLSQLRRELRQSGYTTTGAPKVTRNSATSLTFAMRTGVDDTTDWTPDIRYDLVTSARDPVYKGIAGNPPRYKITRTQNGLPPADVIDDVASLTYTLAAGSRTVEVTLVMLRPSTRWTTGAPPPPIRREYSDQIEMMNAEAN